MSAGEKEGRPDGEKPGHPGEPKAERAGEGRDATDIAGRRRSGRSRTGRRRRPPDREQYLQLKSLDEFS